MIGGAGLVRDEAAGRVVDADDAVGMARWGRADASQFSRMSLTRRSFGFHHGCFHLRKVRRPRNLDILFRRLGMGDWFFENQSHEW